MWINSLPFAISSITIVLYLNYSIAMSSALALSTLMQSNFFIFQLFIQSFDSFSMDKHLWSLICLNLIICLCKVYSLSIQWVVRHILVIFWIDVHVLVVNKTLCPILLNIFINTFSLIYIFMQSRITMYYKEMENWGSIAFTNLSKHFSSTMRKDISYVIIIFTNNSLNRFSLYWGTFNFLLCAINDYYNFIWQFYLHTTTRCYSLMKFIPLVTL